MAKKKKLKRPETDESKPDLPSPETEAEMKTRLKVEIKAEQTKRRGAEMPVQEALQKFKEIRKYVNMDGKFRTGLTKDEMAEGKRMVKQLNVKM